MSWVDDFTWVEKVTRLGPTNLNKVNKAIREMKALTFNVLDYGAVAGASSANAAANTTAFNAAIAACVAAGGGIVYVPAGTFTLQPTVALTLNSHALYVGGNNVTIRGAGRQATKLVFYVYGGLNPNTNYELVGGAVNRGHGIFVDNTVTDFVLEDIEYAGMTTAGGGYTANPAFPASVVDGSGWDITHKCVYVSNNSVHDNIRIRRCHLHDWRGEIVYHGGGVEGGRYFVEDCEIHDTNGDGISITGQCVYRRNEIYNCAFAAIEDVYTSLPETIEDNYIHGCLNGINLTKDPGVSVWGPVTVRRNRLVGVTRNGIVLNNPQSITVEDNLLIDCGQVTNYYAFDIGWTVGTAPFRNLTIRRNTILPLSVATWRGFRIFDNGKGVENSQIVENSLLVSSGFGYTSTDFDLSAMTGTITNCVFDRNVRGGTAARLVSTISSYTADVSDETVVLTGDNVTLTLPSAVAVKGKKILVKRHPSADAGTTATISTVSSQTIDGVAASLVLSNPGQSVMMVSDGANWVTFGRGPVGGTSTQTPGVVATVTIAHGLPKTPIAFNVNPANTNARGAPAFMVTADGTNITLSFVSNLTGAISYAWVWSASV